MFSFSTELRLPAWSKQSKSMMGTAGHVVLRYGGHTAGSAYGQIRSIVDKAADLDEIEKDRRIDRPWSWGIVVQVRQSLEDLRRELKPWAVKGRDVAPMPI